MLEGQYNATVKVKKETYRVTNNKVDRTTWSLGENFNFLLLPML